MKKTSEIFKLENFNLITTVFRLKATFTVFFTVAFTCGAEVNNTVLSKEKKEAVRSALYSLLESEEANEIKQNEEQKEQKESGDPMEKLALHVLKKKDEKTEESGETKVSGEVEKPKETKKSEEDKQSKETKKSEEDKQSKETENSEGTGRSNRKTDPRWRTVLDLRHNSYVKTLFQNEDKLKNWMKRNPELIFRAIQLDNFEMIQFFTEEGRMINAARELTHFSPLHFSIIACRFNSIKFFLDHPEIDLRQKSVWGDNIFHIVFLSGNQEEKLKIINLLFQSEYFSKISDLLNTPNDHNETPLDFYRRNEVYNEEIKTLLESKGALSFKRLSEIKAELLEKKKREQIENNPCATGFYADSI